MGYVETLFGHQDTVLSMDALRAQTVISAGARDKSVRFWKIVDESQLVFRGGGRSAIRELLDGGGLEGLNEDVGGDDPMTTEHRGKGKEPLQHRKFVEGSIECVAMIDEGTFVSGGDSGWVHFYTFSVQCKSHIDNSAPSSICLWTTQKKKPIFTQALAHGFHQTRSETEGLIETPRWITSIASLRYSDLFISGTSLTTQNRLSSYVSSRILGGIHPFMETRP